MKQKTVCILRAGFGCLKKNEFFVASALFEGAVREESVYPNSKDYKKVLRAVAIAYAIAGNTSVAINILKRLMFGDEDLITKKILAIIMARKTPDPLFDPLRLQEGNRAMMPTRIAHPDTRIRLPANFRSRFKEVIYPFGISQREVSKHIGKSEPLLTAYLCGNNSMDKKVFGEIMDFLRDKGVPEDKIIELRKIALGPDAEQCLEKTEVEK